MTLTTITVDLWGTLLFDGPASDDRYRRVRLADFETILRRAGVPATTMALERGYDASARFLAGVWRQHRDVPVVEHVRAILAAVAPGVAGQLAPAVLDELVDAYARPALAMPPRVDPSAAGALETLAGRGHTLALVSNTMRTPGTTLRRLLEGYGLLAWFKHTTFSDEVGIRKPAAAIFLLTLAAVGGRAETALHVGDDPVLDVEGARGAGLRAVQVVGAGARRPHPRADAAIADLAELPAIVAGL